MLRARLEAAATKTARPTTRKRASVLVQVRYRMLQPKSTQHGFNNDTTPRYNREAAAEVWAETLALFARALKV
jgi:dienelactone hydrolase